jgi:hypothetical protein
MESLRQFDHVQQTQRLRKSFAHLLPKGSFAFKLRRSIGRLFDSALTYYCVTKPKSSPAEVGFLWLAVGNSIDPDWLTGVDGQFVDEKGKSIPAADVTPVTASQQMAAWGLWLIEEDAKGGQLTQIPKAATPLSGSELQRLSHKAECIRLATEALMYARRLSETVLLSTFFLCSPPSTARMS